MTDTHHYLPLHTLECQLPFPQRGGGDAIAPRGGNILKYIKTEKIRHIVWDTTLVKIRDSFIGRMYIYSLDSLDCKPIKNYGLFFFR